MKKFLPLALALSLSSCATTSSYQQPSANEAAATITGTRIHKNLLSEFRNARIDKVDNQSVAGLIKTGYETYRVTPGQHTITTECVFGSGVLSGQDPRHGYVDLTFTAKAGEHYLIQSKVQGARVQAWVTQANGRAVSSVESTSYDDIPSPSPVVIVTH